MQVLYSSLVILIIGAIVFWFFDVFYGGHNFRTMQDKIYSFEDIDLTGLREIKASGGNLPRLPYVSWKLGNVKEDKIVMDLKSDFHGYVNGIPTPFLVYKRDTPGIRHIPRRLLLTGILGVRPDLITPEQEEVKKYGFSYKAIYVRSKFITPDEKIDELIEFFENVPEKVWVHVHCTNGSGRTTVALTMLDIMKNAPNVALKDIVKRQYLLGSVDLFDTVVWKGSGYTKADFENRKTFDEKFYTFICQRKAGNTQTWSEWNKQQTNGKPHLP